MAFASLVLVQFFKAYCFRSDRQSALHGAFRNRWLNRAVALELVLLALIVHLPLLQAAFATVTLSLTDWLVLLPAAASVVPVLEAGKLLERRGWFGRLD